MALDPQLWALIQRFARTHRGFDPYAAAAVSMVEGGGRFGAVGDSGSSYGPWQLHVGGALPAGRGAAWANSPEGVNYALQRIYSVSRGLRGRAAVAAIVNRFERPAAPGPEIARATGYYGHTGGGHVPAGGFNPTGPSNGGGGNAQAALAALGLLGPRAPLTPGAPLPTPLGAIQNLTPLPSVSAPPALAPLQGPDYKGQLDAIHKRLLGAV